MKQDLRKALILIEHARDAVAEAAKLVEQDGETYHGMFESSIVLTKVVGQLKRDREDKAIDALIALALKESK